MPPITLIHATGFWLHRAFQGLDGLPPRLADRLIDAARRSLLRLAELVERESAALVLVVGDLISPAEATPGDLDAVIRLGQQLDKRDVPLIWIAGQAERESGGFEDFAFGKNVVTLFPESLTEQLVKTPYGPVRLISLLGGSRDHGEHHLAHHLDSHSRNSIVSIGLAYGATEGDLTPLPHLDYWAVGGGPKRRQWRVGEVIAHDPGPAIFHAPTFDDVPAVSVVEIHPGRRVFIRPTSVSAVRWHAVTLYLSAESSPTAISAQLTQEVEARRSLGDADWLLHLRLVGPPDVLLRWCRQNLETDLLETLRVRYGQAPPFVWPAECIWEPTEPWPEPWMKETSFRGQFLREGAQLARYLLGKETDAEVPEELRGDLPADVAAREELLRQSLFWGLEVLEASSPAASPQGRN